MTDDFMLKAQARLASHATHALGNMLTVVAGNLDLVADDLGRGNAIDAALVTRAQAATRRASELLAGLRAFYGNARSLDFTDLAAWWAGLGDELVRGSMAGRVLSWTGPVAGSTARIDAADLSRAVHSVAALAGETGTIAGDLTLLAAPELQLTLRLTGLEGGVEPDCSPVEPFAWGERHAVGLSAAWGAAHRAHGSIRVDGADTTAPVVRLVLPVTIDSTARLP
jgi:hypothetical protein